MKDIRKITGRPSGVGVKTITTILLTNGQWVALKVGKTDGWFVFNKILKSRKKLGNKWYIGFSTIFNKAISKARKNHNVKIPCGKWEKVIVKHYNLTNPTEINLLNLIL